MYNVHNIILCVMFIMEQICIMFIMEQICNVHIMELTVFNIIIIFG